MTVKMENAVAPPLPRNAAVESAILGAILIQAKGWATAFDELTDDHFYLLQNRVIFEVARRLRDAGKNPDVLLVDDELRRTGKIEDAGGTAYIAGLLDGIPRVFGFDAYLRLLKESALRRRLIHLSNSLAARAFDGSEGADDLLDGAISDLSALAQNVHGDEGLSFRDASVRCLSQMDAEPVPRLFFGIPELDALIGGIRAGDLAVITGSTGHGKTLLAQMLRRQACRDGRHTIFFEGEMLPEDMAARELATRTGVAAWKLRRPERLTTDEVRLLTEAAAHECERCQIVHLDLSLSKIRATARRAKAKRGLDLIILDYDELIDAPGEDENDQQKALVRGVKELAMELGIAALLVSQLRKPLSREDAGMVTLHSIYGSGAKTKHATYVLYVDREFLHDLRGDRSKETVARIIVLKNRFGRCGRIDARFDLDRLEFHAAEDAAKAPDHKMRQAGNSSG